MMIKLVKIGQSTRCAAVFHKDSSNFRSGNVIPFSSILLQRLFPSASFQHLITFTVSPPENFPGEKPSRIVDSIFLPRRAPEVHFFPRQEWTTYAPSAPRARAAKCADRCANPCSGKHGPRARARAHAHVSSRRRFTKCATPSQRLRADHETPMNYHAPDVDTIELSSFAPISFCTTLFLSLLSRRETRTCQRVDACHWRARHQSATDVDARGYRRMR